MRRFLTGVLTLVMICSLTACQEASADQQVFAMDTVMTLAAYGDSCEEALKEKAGVSSRCMPFAQHRIGETCVCCGKPAKALVYWGRAY